MKLQRKVFYGSTSGGGCNDDVQLRSGAGRAGGAAGEQNDGRRPPGGQHHGLQTDGEYPDLLHVQHSHLIKSVR